MTFIISHVKLLRLFLPAILSCTCGEALAAEMNLRQDTSAAPCTVMLYPGEGAGRISPMLMGFNIVYQYTADSAWGRQGSVPVLLRQLGARVLRYPGGTVTTFYHWRYPTGQGHRDSWDPSFDSARNSPSASFMDLDEYLALCKRLHTEPLVGINMGSGMKYNRAQDGINEALALVQHCMQAGFRVKYYYLDNEPYQHDANYTYTAAAYADMVNHYAAALKKADKTIKIIVNTKPFWKKPAQADLSYTKTLIQKAGKNIDYIDVHDYWAWGHATFRLWKSRAPMQTGATGMTYREQRSFYKNLADSLGYPYIDMISLEWNIGPPGHDKPPTQSQAALMIAEQYMQLIQSGMKMAAFWPAYWPAHTAWSSRALLSPGYRPHKVFGMFALFTPVLNQYLVKSTSSQKGIAIMGVRSRNKDTLWVYLINKISDGDTAAIKLKIPGFTGRQYHAVMFSAQDSTAGGLHTKHINIKKETKNNFIFKMPACSLARLTLIK